MVIQFTNIKFAILIAFLCCYKTTYSQVEEFVPFYSVGNVTIGVSKFKECKKEYPNAEYDKYWESSPGIAIGNFVRKVIIYDEGKVFFYSKKKRFGRFYLRSIRLTNDYKGKTAHGIGIGSTYSRIINQFGNARILGHSKRKAIKYFRGIHDRQNNVGVIEFSCYNEFADSTNFVVDEIYMR